jgi:hypothetical protein
MRRGIRGKYYYGDATLTHSGPRSIKLILRNVEDLKNGVVPLRVHIRVAVDQDAAKPDHAPMVGNAGADRVVEPVRVTRVPS